jgi:hypothetical protein
MMSLFVSATPRICNSLGLVVFVDHGFVTSGEVGREIVDCFIRGTRAEDSTKFGLHRKGCSGVNCCLSETCAL